MILQEWIDLDEFYRGKGAQHFPGLSPRDVVRFFMDWEKVCMAPTQIYVCVKHVPDLSASITVIDDNRIDENIIFLLNPYDEHAITEAVKIKKCDQIEY